MSDTPRHNNIFRNSIGFQLMVLFGSFFVTLMAVSAAALAFNSISGVTERAAIFMSSAIQCLLAFCLPAWLTAKFASPTPCRWLNLDKPPSFKAFIGVIIVYMLALPAMNFLIEWNASIHFPEALKELEDTLRTWEETNDGIARKLLSTTDVGGLVLSVAIVGVLTGFSEELFFRGTLQGIFSRSHIGETLSIWGAATIFSAIHFQFFGFIPRLLMGAFFGYLLIWSRSLWLPSFAHALNNSIVVISGSPLICGDSGNSMIDTVGMATDNAIPWHAIASALATLVFLLTFRGFFFRQEIAPNAEPNHK